MEGLQVMTSQLQQGDLYDENGVEGCILCNTDPFNPQEVSEDRTESTSFGAFHLASSAPRAFRKTSKPVLAVLYSLGIWIIIYIDMFVLHQQSRVLQQMFAQVVGDNFPGKAGLPGQGREMFSHPMPVYCLSRGPVGLDNDATFSSSSKAKRKFGHMSTSLCSEEWLNEDSVHSDWTHASCFSDGDHAYPTSLQRSPALTPYKQWLSMAMGGK